MGRRKKQRRSSQSIRGNLASLATWGEERSKGEAARASGATWPAWPHGEKKEAKEKQPEHQGQLGQLGHMGRRKKQRRSSQSIRGNLASLANWGSSANLEVLSPLSWGLLLWRQPSHFLRLSLRLARTILPRPTMMVRNSLKKEIT